MVYLVTYTVTFYSFHNLFIYLFVCFFFQAEDGIRDLVRSRGLGDVYKRQEPTPCNHHLARIDLLVNGMVVHRIFDDLKGGSVSVDLEKYRNQKVQYRIAAWDMAFNCTLSEEREFMVD